MSDYCTPSDCESCGLGCSPDNDFSAHLSEGSAVRHVYAVMSGKGGVGKSLVAVMLADAFAEAGYKTAILDADITGPSIPRAFNLGDGLLSVNENKLMIPPKTRNGISVMSANLLLENEADPIVWRGTLIASAVKQFYEETCWGEIDYMLVDMPPGTGDVPLTVFQSLPVEGIIMVTSPQDLVSMIVGKAVGMARLMNIPILGVVENMAYYVCPECGCKHSVFGDSDIDAVAETYELSVLARIPIDPGIAELVDSGRADELDTGAMSKVINTVTALEKISRMRSDLR